MENKHQKIRKIVVKELSSSHHDMEHVMRVYNLCLRLAENEPNVDLDILRTAALLHDIARFKEFQDKTGAIEHAAFGVEMAEGILRTLGYSEEKIAKIKHCIAVHRYRRERKPQSIEAMILFDADKLDAIGAVGVARAFMMAGHYNQKLYSDISIEEYLKENVVGGKAEGRLEDISKHTPDIEYQLKFRHVPERLYMQKAKMIAKERLQFMESFFERLRTEISGEK